MRERDRDLAVPCGLGRSPRRLDDGMAAARDLERSRDLQGNRREIKEALRDCRPGKKSKRDDEDDD